MKQENESWREYVARVGAQQGLEREVLEIFDGAVSWGTTEEAACFQAFYEWDVCEAPPEKAQDQEEMSWKQRALSAEARVQKLEGILKDTVKQSRELLNATSKKLTDSILPDGWEFGDRSSNWFELNFKFNGHREQCITVMRYSGEVSCTDGFGNFRKYGPVDTNCPDNEMALSAIQLVESLSRS